MSKIVEVARLANVAKSTVSNVLSNKRYVSEEIREKVLWACDELSYKKNILASSLVTKRTNIIGLFLTAEENKFDEFYGDLIRGVSMTLSENGYFVMLYLNVDREEKMREIFLQGKMYIDGAIILTPCMDDFRTRELYEDNIPYVLIGKEANPVSDNKYTVDVQNEQNTYQITMHLLKQGHRKIVLLNSKEDYTISADRLLGYTRAFAEFDLAVDREKIFNLPDELGCREQIFKALDSVRGQFTACIVSSDINGASVYKYMEANSLTVGKDVAVAALGGCSVAKDCKPALTTVDVDYSELGANASRLIVDILSGKVACKTNLTSPGNILYNESSCFKL